jgi:hypothetical protein
MLYAVPGPLDLSTVQTVAHTWQDVVRERKRRDVVRERG